MEEENKINKCIENLQSNYMVQIHQGIIQIESMSKKEREKLFPYVLKLFNHPDRWCKKQAILGFAYINNKKSRDIIIDLLNDPATRKGKGAHSLEEAAIISLGKFYDKTSFNYLKKLFSLDLPRNSFKRKRRSVIIRTFAEMAVYYDDALNLMKYYAKQKEYKDFCREELVFIKEERKYLKSSKDSN